MVALYVEGKNRKRGKGTESLSRGSVQVWGKNLAYQASGNPEAGPTILFLHESGSDGTAWQAQLTGLPTNARYLVPDLPGHGRSEGDGCATVADYRTAVLEFLDALAIRWPVVLAGVCLGAAVAVDVAACAPDRVQGLILTGISNGGRASEETLAAAALGEAPEAFVERLFKGGASERLVGERLKRWRHTNPQVRFGDLRALYGYSLQENLSRVSHPVLLIAGADDPVATPELFERLAAGRAETRVVSIPGAGCLAMSEQPTAFNRAVSDFLHELHLSEPIAPELNHPGGYRRF